MLLRRCSWCGRDLTGVIRLVASSYKRNVLVWRRTDVQTDDRPVNYAYSLTRLSVCPSVFPIFSNAALTWETKR